MTEKKGESLILIGDARKRLAELPAGSARTCVTSPPYFGLRDYGTGAWEGGDPTCSHKRDSKHSDFTITGHKNPLLTVGDAIYKSVCPRCGAIREDDQIGLEETPEAYVQEMVELFREVWRVLSDDGTLWLNLGDSYFAKPKSNYDGKSPGLQSKNYGTGETTLGYKQQAEKFGAIYMEGSVVEADLSKRPFRLKVEDEWIETRTLIVASGASARWLGLPSEYKLIGRGVSSCATCDGFFYRDKQIMVVGGGDTAMEEANFLTRFGRNVMLVHRRDTFRASKVMLDRVKANPKIELILNTAVDEIFDVTKGEVTGVRLKNLVTGELTERAVDGFFVAIGHIPNTKIFEGQLDLDPDGYLVSHGGARTNIAGVFHAGDVQDRVYRQAITAAGAGCMAAIEAERFLEAEGH
jgi:thioredoxin reductase (NADPH)